MLSTGAVSSGHPALRYTFAHIWCWSGLLQETLPPASGRGTGRKWGSSPPPSCQPWLSAPACTREPGSGRLAALHQGAMALLAPSSCLNPFQSHWVLPSTFPSTLGPCWRISLHIARINELRRHVCPSATAGLSVCLPT